MSIRSSSLAGHGRLIATATIAVFVATGLSLLGVAIASQRSVPEPPANVLGSSETAAGSQLPVRGAEERGAAKPLTLPQSLPVTLDIPAIDVHSVVRDVGLTPEGTVDTPAPGPHYNDAAWYRHSPTPGSLGPAVLLGHVDSATDGPSVFFRLGDLRPGDRVSVTRADDSVAVFIVDEVRRYAKDDFPTEAVYGDIDHAGLRILTCGGAFDDTTGHYLDNIVVFASLATDQPARGASE